MTVSIEKPISEDLIITVKDKPVIVEPPIEPPVVRQPFKVNTIPGLIQAEDYDKWKDAVKDIDAINQGDVSYRPDSVDIEKNLTGFNIGWFNAGDFYEYTVTAVAGSYRFDIPVACVNAGSIGKVLSDGVQIGTFTVPQTANWQDYKTVSLNCVFTAGTKIIKIECTAGNFNYGHFSFNIPVVVVVPPPPTGNVINVLPTDNLKAKIAAAPSGSNVIVAAGSTYITEQVLIPPGVNVDFNNATLKPVPAFYFPNGGVFAPDKYLVVVKSVNRTNGNQTIKNLNIDGVNRNLHGGLLVENRDNTIIENVKCNLTNFCGLWVNWCNNVTIKGFKALDCAWGSFSWCSGALQIANSTNVDCYGHDISENRGYGVKNLGHMSNTPVTNVKIHDGRVSVNPHGLWNGGKAPNITIEFWGNSFPGTEIYNNYIDNTLSLVNEGEGVRATPIKIYNNTFDINGPRAQGYGYSVELSINDAEVYGNSLIGGSAGFVNWHIKQCKGWNIHHNYFYNITRMINSQCKASKGGGLKDVTITNNTVEMNSGVVAFLELNSSNGDNVKIQKNLFIGTSGNPAIVSCVNGATMVNSVVSDNFYSGSLNTNISGVTQTNNLTGDPMITKTGVRPNPYYKPLAGSPLLARDIGAFK